MTGWYAPDIAQGKPWKKVQSAPWILHSWVHGVLAGIGGWMGVLGRIRGFGFLGEGNGLSHC